VKLVICHTSDSHFDEQDRLDETAQLHWEIVAKADDAGVDVFLHAGDFFHRKSTPAERTALARFLQAAGNVAPVIGAKGNHDAAGDLEIFNRIQSQFPVAIFDRPTSAPGSALTMMLETRMRPFGVLALPWFDKAHLVSTLSAEFDAEQTRNATIAAARRLLTLLAIEAQRISSLGNMPLLVGHVLVAGSETGTGFIPIGTTVELSPHDIAEVGCAYAALGHVHKAQEWLDGRVAYSGSPRRCNFGEPEEKGFRLVTIEGDPKTGRYDVENRFVPLTYARRIVLLENTWDGGWNIPLGEGAIRKGDLVRFRYRVRAEHLHEVDETYLRRFYLEGGGADEVQIEAVIVHEERIRSAAITTAQTLFAKVEAYWQAKGIDVPPETRERVRAKLAALETPAPEVIHEAA